MRHHFVHHIWLCKRAILAPRNSNMYITLTAMFDVENANETVRHWTTRRASHLYTSPMPDRPVLNLLKPTGYVMHQQFNVQQM